jgi:hypothetical protein
MEYYSTITKMKLCHLQENGWNVAQDKPSPEDKYHVFHLYAES